MDKSMFNQLHRSTRLAISIVALLVFVTGALWFFRRLVPVRESQPNLADIGATTVYAPPLTPTPFVVDSPQPSFSVSPGVQPSSASTSSSSSVTGLRSRFFIVVNDAYTNTFEPRTPLPQNVTRFPASLDEAEILAGFKILEPTFLPDGYALVAIDYSAEDQHVGLVYSNRSTDPSRQLYFLQQPTAFSEHQSLIGAGAIIQKLQVNDVPAEYVQGRFDDAGSTSTVDRLRWNPLGDLGRFRWEKDNYYYHISSGSEIDSASMRLMAESLQQHMATPDATPLPTLTFEETPAD
jgi:hypothetical protein